MDLAEVDLPPHTG